MPAYVKWQPVFAECEAALGFSGDATNDVLSAWSKLATDSFHRRQGDSELSALRSRRSNSLTHLHSKTVKIPVDLIPLERARALTSASTSHDSFLTNSDSTADRTSMLHFSKSQSLLTGFHRCPSPICTFPVEKPEISRPVNLEESLDRSFHPGRPYRNASHSLRATRASSHSPEQEKGSFSDPEDTVAMAEDHRRKGVSNSPDVKTAIQNYVDNVCMSVRSVV